MYVSIIRYHASPFCNCVLFSINLMSLLAVRFRRMHDTHSCATIPPANFVDSVESPNRFESHRQRYNSWAV